MVNLLDVYPLSFDEFLEATDESLYAYYQSIQKEQHIEEIFHNRLTDAYHSYLIIGGMPECVSSWIKYKDPARIIQIQHELITVYENDFSKHNGKVNSGRILMVFRSIPSQLLAAWLSEKWADHQYPTIPRQKNERALVKRFPSWLRALGRGLARCPPSHKDKRSSLAFFLRIP